MKVASSKTHDLIEQDEIVVKVQRMFPNCAKYVKCCTDDKEFWNKLDAKVKSVKPVKQPFRRQKINHEPTGFEGW